MEGGSRSPETRLTKRSLCCPERSPDSERSLLYEQIHSHSQHLLLRVLSFSDPLISKRMKVKILRGMLSHHGHGMPKMKPVGFVGWHLMVVVLIVNSLEMIAR
eukprot:XP_003633955.1 PREDICTED: uncharacterized protein LOC100258557 isoform X1 [Vitis vinifera]